MQHVDLLSQSSCLNVWIAPPPHGDILGEICTMKLRVKILKI
jgi:hypothetical protein